MQVKKLTVAELRKIITEAMDDGHHKKNELEEQDAEAAAAAEKAETAEEEAQIQNESLDESVQLERWKKLAGLLNSQSLMATPRYGIWFTSSDVASEMVVGICHNWPEAREMAQNLYTIKTSIDNARDVCTGIFLFEPGVIYTSHKPRRWQVMPLMTSNT